MPNVGHKWTPEEERDAVEFGWDIFHSIHPDITRNAYRIRRNALLRAPKPEPQPSRLRLLVRRFIGA